MVVSEIMERLSPNMAPEATAAMHRTTSEAVASLMETAKGARAEMVPTRCHGDGHEAGDQEQARHRELAGQVVQEQIDRAVGAAGGLDRAGKGACGQKDQAHGEDVLIRHPVGHYLQLGVEVQGPVLDARLRTGR